MPRAAIDELGIAGALESARRAVDAADGLASIDDLEVFRVRVREAGVAESEGGHEI
jgi:hypothetical protein